MRLFYKSKDSQCFWRSIMTKSSENIKSEFMIIIIIIIIINSYILVTLIKSTHEELYVMYVEWTKFSEVENHLLFIRLLHAVETTRLKLCIKFIHVDCMLKNECSSHFKLLQKLCFHHHSCCCSEIFRDHNNYSIV